MWEILARWSIATADYFDELFGARHAQTVADIKKAAANTTEEEDRNLVHRATDGLDTHSQLDDEIIEELHEIADYPWLIRMIATGYAYSVIIGGRLASWSSAIVNLRAQKINADIRPQLVDASVAVSYFLKQPTERRAALEILDRWGLPDDQQAMLLDSAEQLPSLTELLVLRNRDIITNELAVDILERQGFTRENAVDLLQLRFFVPSPQDVVSLAGREAYEEDAIARFGLDRDMPDEVVEAAAKAGVTPEVIRQFWVAHWTNPSLLQVFQMIHRKVEFEDGREWTKDDLETYYRLADINPFFGDMLKQIAFLTPGRVDIRRLLSRNIIDRDKAKLMYEWLGYNDENAEILTQFAEEEQRTFGKELSRTQLEKLYKLGVIDALEIAADFVDIGYDEEEAQFLIHLLDVDVEEDKFKSFIARAEYEYKGRVRDEVETSEFLSQAGLTSERIRDLLVKWANERVMERTLPTKTDLAKWLGSDIITVEEFKATMALRRYSAGDIDRYIESEG